MNKNNNDFNQIDKIKDQVDIVKTIGHFLTLKKAGVNYFALCPFHTDHNPSLSISPKKKIWKCFVCGEKGDAISFIQKYKKIPYIQALQEACKINGIEAPDYINSTKTNQILDANKKYHNANKLACDYYHQVIYKKENEKIVNYLATRGIDQKIINKFKIGYADENKDMIYQILTNKNNILGNNENVSTTWSTKELIDLSLIKISESGTPYDFFHKRIIIPIFDIYDNVVGFSGRLIESSSDSISKYLNISETPVFNKGQTFFNLNNVLKTHTNSLIITEGFMDCISLYQKGIENAVALMGTALTNSHINLLLLKNFNKVTMCLDNDKPGIDATINNAIKLIKRGIDVNIFLFDSDKYKDIDELIQKEKMEDFKLYFEKHIVDFITYVISKLITKDHNKLNELEKIKKVLNLICEYGEQLLLNDYFKLISLKTGIEEDLIKKEYLKIEKQINNIEEQKIFNYINRHVVSISDDLAENQNKHYNSNQSVKIDLEEVFKRKIDKNTKELQKVLQNLIIFLFNNNEFVPTVEEKLSLSTMEGFVEIEILKSIFFFYEKNNNLNIDQFIEYWQDEKKQDPKIINYYKSKVNYLNAPTKSLMSKRNVLDSLLDKIFSLKRGYVIYKNCKKISSSKTSKEEKNEALMDINNLPTK